MELEFRTADGMHIVTFHKNFANNTLNKLNIIPELERTKMKLGAIDESKKEYVVYKCIKLCSYKFFEEVEVLLKEGDYIKVII